MKLRVKHAVLVALVCALVVFALPALGDSQARIVRLSFLDGVVKIDRNTGQGFEKAITNMPITQGAKLSTGDDGEAEVEFENGSTVRLAPDTEIRFDQLSLRGDGGKVSLITLDDGTAYFDIKVKDQDEFRVAYGGRDVRVAKSAHFRAESADRQARLAAFKGELELQGAEGEVKVKKNETLSLKLDAPSEYQLAKGIDQGQYDWWDKEREDYHSRYAYNSRQDSFANSPYSYGWSDLNYYGSFMNIPGYGYGWRPYGVGYNWDPFASGYWVWYPGWGYTWVSPYPWGWMPYRYGAWQFFPGYGWAWTPGFWQTSFYTPRVINPPPTYRPPTPPSNPRTTPVAVGNPVPVPPHAPNPRARQNQNDEIVGRKPGRPVPSERTAPAVNSGAGVKSSVAPGSGATAPVQRETPVGKGNPGMRRDGLGDVQHREPTQMPRSMETPRVERPATIDRPAPRVSTPPAPRSFEGGASRPAMAPSAPAARPPAPSPSVHTPNPK